MPCTTYRSMCTTCRATRARGGSGNPMNDTRFARWRRRLLVLTLLGLIALGVVPALVGLIKPSFAARVPDDPEAFVARFGEPDLVNAAEPAGPHAPSATRSLVYRKVRVRAAFAF